MDTYISIDINLNTVLAFLLVNLIFITLMRVDKIITTIKATRVNLYSSASDVLEYKTLSNKLNPYDITSAIFLACNCVLIKKNSSVQNQHIF